MYLKQISFYGNFFLLYFFVFIWPQYNVSWLAISEHLLPPPDSNLGIGPVRIYPSTLQQCGHYYYPSHILIGGGALPLQVKILKGCGTKKFSKIFLFRRQKNMKSKHYSKNKCFFPNQHFFWTKVLLTKYFYDKRF